ncbi:hypothetical protein XarbCFBP7610_19835 [Xanthomonas arboricola]|nr:hypothetical protein XarbCFBP7610_19835 [Xanthomonas arboricola]
MAVTLLDRKKPIRPHLVGRLRCMCCMHRLPLTVAGPYAAWMPRKSLQGRTCGVSCEGGRARACSKLTA